MFLNCWNQKHFLANLHSKIPLIIREAIKTKLCLSCLNEIFNPMTKTVTLNNTVTAGEAYRYPEDMKNFFSVHAFEVT